MSAAQPYASCSPNVAGGMPATTALQNSCLFMFIRLPRRSRGEGEVVKSGKVRRGETQRPAPETSALPRIRVIRRAIIESAGPDSAD